MSINYITVEETKHVDTSKAIEIFENNIPKKMLFLLENKNVALYHDEFPVWSLNRPAACFTVRDEKPLVMIDLNAVTILNKSKLPKFISKAIINNYYKNIIQHELIHLHQYERGDLDFVENGVIWKNEFHSNDLVNYNMSKMESVISEITKPYEIEPYLHSLVCGSPLDKIWVSIFKKQRTMKRVLKKAYLEEFGKEFDGKEFDQIFKV